MDLNPLPVLYRDLVPILKTFTRQYRKGDLAPRGSRVQSRMVEESVQSVGQVLATIGALDPASQGK